MTENGALLALVVTSTKNGHDYVTDVTFALYSHIRLHQLARDIQL
jgi:hypothetical protein